MGSRLINLRDLHWTCFFFSPGWNLYFRRQVLPAQHLMVGRLDALSADDLSADDVPADDMSIR